MAQADRGLRPRPDRLGAEGLAARREPRRPRARPGATRAARPRRAGQRGLARRRDPPGGRDAGRRARRARAPRRAASCSSPSPGTATWRPCSSACAPEPKPRASPGRRPGASVTVRRRPDAPSRTCGRSATSGRPAPCGEVYARASRCASGWTPRRGRATRSSRTSAPSRGSRTGAAGTCSRSAWAWAPTTWSGRSASPRSLTGVDLTRPGDRAHARASRAHGLRSRLLVTDAEHLPFRDASFDLVYSWGVIHHSPDTPAAVREIARVLRPGGRARVMIYQHRSLVGRHALAALRAAGGPPLALAATRSTPGTWRARAPRPTLPAQARAMFAGLRRRCGCTSELSPGDLLLGRGRASGTAGCCSTRRAALYPRWAVRRLFAGCGLHLLIEASRPQRRKRPSRENDSGRERRRCSPSSSRACGAVTTGRTSLEAWRVPVDYYGDALVHARAR